jgi:DNA-binding response OmpR family regulator
MKGNRTVLIIEDDPVMLRGLKDNFSREGYVVHAAADGNRGLDMALRNAADLIVLDIMLPGVNGYEICRSLRKEGIDTPTIMLTAKSEESDVLLGLGLGADDYVTKPFSIRELIARAEAVLRRRAQEGGAAGAVVRFARFTLDREARELRNDGAVGAVVALSPKEYDLLEYLAVNPGKALSRETILNAVWGYDGMVTGRSVDRFVTNLRKKIEAEPREPRHILTVRGFGYKFVGDGG